jgi:hypothetical protein
MSWIFCAPLGAASLHIVEEFAWPGGFLAWDRSFRPAIGNSITPRFAIGINALLLAVCAAVAFAGPTPRGVATWLTVAAVLLSNVGFHVLGTIRTRRYSPGVVTAVLLYLPLGVIGFWWFLHADLASWSTALTALCVGGAYPLWSSLLHRSRSRGTAV